jgi:hypothetical protein
MPCDIHHSKRVAHSYVSADAISHYSVVLMPYDIDHRKSVNFQYVSPYALSDCSDAQSPYNIHHRKKAALHCTHLCISRLFYCLNVLWHISQEKGCCPLYFSANYSRTFGSRVSFKLTFSFPYIGITRRLIVTVWREALLRLVVLWGSDTVSWFLVLVNLPWKKTVLSPLLSLDSWEEAMVCTIVNWSFL